VLACEGVKTYKMLKSILLPKNPDNSVLIAAGDSGDGTSEITVYNLND
jgi:hypothetical protein